jgi:hypothetical protein
MQRVNTSLNLTELRENKKKIQGGSMDGIKDAIDEVDVKTGDKSSTKKADAPKILINSNHKKLVVGVSEVTQMKLVLEHPAFKSNPFSAIMTHLKNEVGEGRDCSGDKRLGKGGKKEGGGGGEEGKMKRNGSRKRFNK